MYFNWKKEYSGMLPTDMKKLRESEILHWLSLGKTNRNIGTILSLRSPIVNKHLEQIYQKLGVDDRTAAAVLADRKLSVPH